MPFERKNTVSFRDEMWPDDKASVWNKVKVLKRSRQICVWVKCTERLHMSLFQLLLCTGSENEITQQLLCKRAVASGSTRAFP